MAFFRTINFSDPLATITGDGVTLRTPQMTDYGEWAALREGSREFLKPWSQPGRPTTDPERLPAPHQALRRRPAHRSGLRIYHRAQHRRCAARRFDPCQHPPRRRPGRQRRLLDGAAFHTPRPHVGGGARGDPVRFRHAAVGIAGSRLHPDECGLDAASGRSVFRPRRLCPGTSVHHRIWQDHLSYARLAGRGLITISSGGAPQRPPWMATVRLQW